MLLAAAEFQSAYPADDPMVSASLAEIYVRNPSSASLYRANANNTVVAEVPTGGTSRVGMSVMGMTDIYGGSFGRDMVTFARSGGGMQYVHIPRREGKENRMALMFTMPLGEEWFIVSTVELI